MNKIWNKAITYGALSDALLSLGFERFDGELINAHADSENQAASNKPVRPPVITRYTAYSHSDYDALIVLPLKDPKEVVRPAHYLSVETDITWRGILSEEAWYKLLMSKSHTAKRTKKAAVPVEAA